MSVIPDLGRRSTEPEQLDTGVAERETLASLRDLQFVNRWLGGTRRTVAAIRRHLPPGGRLLDVGSASGDLPGQVAARAPGPILAVALDVKALHLHYAPPQLRRVVADVRALPFGDGAFDVVSASLFLHHFAPEEVPTVLAGLSRVARRALVVTDLERALVPYLFGRAFFSLLFRSPVSVADGLVSIRRGFRRQELQDAFAAAGLRQVRVRRHFPYRLLAVAARDGGRSAE